MNVRYRVELSQAERDELTAMLGGGKHIQPSPKSKNYCDEPLTVMNH
ncbi:hypothetical protein ACF1BQ_027945 [Bradyrhizobium sp. RDT10]